MLRPEKKELISVETLSGIKLPTVIVEDSSVTQVEVDMGMPKIEGLNENLTIEEDQFTMNRVSMGNPHCVIFVPDIEEVDFFRLGPDIKSLGKRGWLYSCLRHWRVCGRSCSHIKRSY